MDKLGFSEINRRAGVKALQMVGRYHGCMTPEGFRAARAGRV